MDKTKAHLGPIQVIRLHVSWLVSLGLLGERNSCAYKSENKTSLKQLNILSWTNRISASKDRPVGGSVVAIIREEIEIELPKDMKRNSAVGS